MRRNHQLYALRKHRAKQIFPGLVDLAYTA